MDGVFSGFSSKAFEFLSDLSNNNQKAWFDAHKETYQTELLEPAQALITALAGPLSSLDVEIHAEPRVNGSIFRIHRDVRFSKDKRPYKDHFDFWFWHGERKAPISAFFMRITATRLILGAGTHGFEKQRLQAFRKRLEKARQAEHLAQIVEKLEALGYEIGGSHYARLPRGVEANSKAQQRFMRFKGLWASSNEAHPAALQSPELVDHCIQAWQKMLPLHQWLLEDVKGD